MGAHYNTQHLHFPRRGGSAPMAHTIPTAARKFLKPHRQALVFIIYFVVNILVLYPVASTRSQFQRGITKS